MVSSTRELLQANLARLASAKGPTGRNLVGPGRKLANLFDSLAEVAGPIRKQAEAEQRNGDWLNATLRKSFGNKLAEYTRLSHEVAAAKDAHARAAPTLPAFDRGDFLAAMEVVAVAQRVAATPADAYHKLTTAERVAALRAPVLAKLPESVAGAWNREIVSSIEPERYAAHQADAEAIEQAEQILFFTKTELQSASGFLDVETKRPSPQWSEFEREVVEPIAEEIRQQEAIEALRREEDARQANAEALRKLRSSEHRASIDAIRRA
jgi:hypothetical protein